MLHDSKSITLNPKEECKPEIKEAKKRGTTFTLLLYNPIWHEAHFVVFDPDEVPSSLTIRRGDPKTLTILPTPQTTDNPTNPTP
jgi:hypothetical protein